MATNEFIPVVFNDGEPLDPTKLNNLVRNINNVYQSAAISLSNSTTGTNPQVPVIFTFRHKFENVKAGTPQNIPFNFGDRFTKEDCRRKNRKSRQSVCVCRNDNGWWQ